MSFKTAMIMINKTLLRRQRGTLLQKHSHKAKNVSYSLPDKAVYSPDLCQCRWNVGSESKVESVVR